MKVAQADTEEKDDFEELSPQNETKKANYHLPGQCAIAWRFKSMQADQPDLIMSA